MGKLSVFNFDELLIFEPIEKIVPPIKDLHIISNDLRFLFIIRNYAWKIFDYPMVTAVERDKFVIFLNKFGYGSGSLKFFVISQVIVY